MENNLISYGESKLKEHNLDPKLAKYLYKYLPESIVIKDIEEVEDRFHSRYNAKSKVYLYKII